MSASDVDPEIADLVPGYLEKRRADVRRLEEAAGRDDFETVARTAHRIRGSAGSYGLDGLAGAARELERAAKGGEPDAVREGLRRLSECLDRAPER